MTWRRLVVAGVLVVALGSVAIFGATTLLDPAPGADTYYLFVDPASPDETPSDDEMVRYANLSPGQQRVFDRARTTNESAAIPSEVDEQVWIDSQYVRYQNRTYRAAVAAP
ncbi:MAG: hypothetical protein A07HB70_00380 [uncultured archaeon A07HB70]|nr:MAG: hypothetical protein A07HB70_00380 [uncultured archaeon A07HB70]